MFGSERPSTALSERLRRRQAKREGKVEKINGSYLDDNKTPPEGNKPARRETTSNGRDVSTVSDSPWTRFFKI